MAPLHCLPAGTAPDNRIRRRDPEIGGHGSGPDRSRVLASIRALPLNHGADALFVEPEPALAVGEVVLDPHGDNGADAGEGVGHDADQGTVAQADEGQGVSIRARAWSEVSDGAKSAHSAG
jgi:hypothetical protein